MNADDLTAVVETIDHKLREYAERNRLICSELWPSPAPSSPTSPGGA